MSVDHSNRLIVGQSRGGSPARLRDLIDRLKSVGDIDDQIVAINVGDVESSPESKLPFPLASTKTVQPGCPSSPDLSPVVIQIGDQGAAISPVRSRRSSRDSTAVVGGKQDFQIFRRECRQEGDFREGCDTLKIELSMR